MFEAILKKLCLLSKTLFYKKCICGWCIARSRGVAEGIERLTPNRVGMSSKLGVFHLKPENKISRVKGVFGP